MHTINQLSKVFEVFIAYYAFLRLKASLGVYITLGGQSDNTYSYENIYTQKAIDCFFLELAITRDYNRKINCSLEPKLAKI